MVIQSRKIVIIPCQNNEMLHMTMIILILILVINRTKVIIYMK